MTITGWGSLLLKRHMPDGAALIRPTNEIQCCWNSVGRIRRSCHPAVCSMRHRMPDGAALIRPTNEIRCCWNSVGRIRRSRHPAVCSMRHRMPDGAALIRPTHVIRRSRHPALRRFLAVRDIGGKHIPQAAQRFDKRWLMRVDLNLAPQAHNQHINGAVKHLHTFTVRQG